MVRGRTVQVVDIDPGGEEHGEQAIGMGTISEPRTGSPHSEHISV